MSMSDYAQTKFFSISSDTNEIVEVTKQISLDIDMEKICRTCLTVIKDEFHLKNSLVNFFELGETTTNLKLMNMLHEITGLQFGENDKLPQQICADCLISVGNAFFFRLQSHAVNDLLDKILEDKNIKNASNPLVNYIITLNKDNSFVVNNSIDCIIDNTSVYMSNNDVGANEENIKEGNNICISQKQDKNGEILTSDTNCEVVTNSVSNNEMNVDKEDSNRIIISIEVDENKLSMQKCTLCDMKFDSNRQIKKHFNTYHPFVKKPYECVICKLNFSYLHSLKRHQRIHDEKEKNKKCEHCNFKFVYFSELKSHTTRYHTQDYPYACKVCANKFNTKIHLENHIKRTKH